ncbi:Glycolate oxidase iron-sulfur subunit [Planctomycetales bacterium 10988]|nr:Glycolate oxidase iron-sulfur subunit [Planctomycetales bacterium 10988]
MSVKESLNVEAPQLSAPTSTEKKSCSQSAVSFDTKVNYDRFLDCIHCGLCTATCPTYVELGNENDGPRGRIHLMRAVTDERVELSPQIRQHLDLCLDCRACETACPSGVKYGEIIEPFRSALAEKDRNDGKKLDLFHRLILFKLFPSAKLTRLSLIPARIAQSIKLDQWFLNSPLKKLLPKKILALTEMLPPLGANLPSLPTHLPAKGKQRAKVALFTGCVADAVFRSTHWATARVLQENGCEVVVPKNQTCCGAIHVHSGQEDQARPYLEANLTAFEDPSIDAIIVNVAGCGAMLKEYHHHFKETTDQKRLKTFMSKVKDVHEFLDELGVIPPKGRIEATATYHDACHLRHAQQIAAAPRNLLNQIPGLKLIPLPESELCCGAAGTYNLTQPEMANRLGVRKIENVKRTDAELLLAANAGCLLQLHKVAKQQHLNSWIGHPIDLLDLSYQQKQPKL